MHIIESKYNRKTSFRLAPRDINIFTFIIKHQFVTLDQIQRKFWNGKNTATSYVRIKKLVDKGFLLRFQTYQMPAQAYCLTEASQKLVAASGVNISRYKTFRPYMYRLNQFEHNKRITDACLILDQFPNLGDLRTEAETRRTWTIKKAMDKGKRLTKIPDIFFEVLIQQNKLPCAIEVELIYKSRRRYEYIFKFYETSNLAFIFYIIPNKELMGKIKRWVPISAADKFYFALHEDFMREGLACKFTTKDKAQITMAELLWDEGESNDYTA